MKLIVINSENFNLKFSDDNTGIVSLKYNTKFKTNKDIFNLSYYIELMK